MNSIPPRFALRSRRVCTPDGVTAATVIIAGETIQAVVPDDNEGSPEDLGDIPCEDLGQWVLAPGIIDAHVHVNEPGRTQWEGFETATKAAVAGGVTTIVDMPLNSDPVTTNAVALAVKQSAASDKCWCDVGFYGGLIPGNGRQIESLVNAGVLGIKAFLCDSGLGDFPAALESDLRVALQILRQHGVPLLVHAESVDDAAPVMTDPSSYAQYLSSRPDQWEINAHELLIRLCEEFNAPIHIVHLSTTSSLQLLAAAKQRGLPLTVETCPHYLMFAAERIAAGDTRFKCAPPIRAESNRRQLVAAMTESVAGAAEKYLIDTVGSDHSPCLPENKQLDTGDFQTAWGGIASLQLTLPALWTAVRDTGMSFSRVAALLSYQPAQLLGLQDRKGSLKPGLDADLCVWNPEEQWTVHAGELHHRHTITPYDGQKLIGKVKRTYLRGRLVSMEEEIMGNEPAGKIVLRW